MIELKNIDLSKVTIVSQYSKAVEEENEYHEALSNFIKQADTKEHVIEEFFDWIQAELGILYKRGITAEEVMLEYPKHFINQSEKGEKEMSKFTVLKKVVVLDLQGECGRYHIENNKVVFRDVEYSNSEEVEAAFKVEEENLTNRLISLRKQKEELKEVMKEYVEEV